MCMEACLQEMEQGSSHERKRPRIAREYDRLAMLLEEVVVQKENREFQSTASKLRGEEILFKIMEFVTYYPFSYNQGKSPKLQYKRS